MNLLARIYAVLLHLYPHKFRDEFGDEMQAVFVDAVQEATQTSLIEVMWFCLHELRELPINLALEHWTRLQKGNITMYTTLNNQRPRWFFYLGWIVLTVISVPIAWMIAMAIMSQIIQVVGDTIQVDGQRHITEDFLLFYVFLPVLGLLTGLLQYFLLRGYLPRMGWWIAATVFGWLLCFLGLLFFSFFGLYPPTIPPALAFVLAAVFIGGSIGLFQWLLLNRRVNHAAYWIFANGIGWAAALLLTDGAISTQQEVLSVILLPPIAGSIAWWLILDKQPRRDDNESNSSRNALPEPPEPLDSH